MAKTQAPYTVNELLKQRAVDYPAGLHPHPSPLSALSSRASFDSEIWTTSSMGTRSPEAAGMEYITTPRDGMHSKSSAQAKACLKANTLLQYAKL